VSTPSTPPAQSPTPDKAPAAAPRPAAAEPGHGVAELTPRPPPWWKTLRATAPTLLGVLIALGFIGVIFLVWWLLTRGDGAPGTPDGPFISPGKLPSPGDVFGSLGTLSDRNLGAAISDSMMRVFKGIGLAALIGVGLGVLAASFGIVRAAIMPVVIFLRSVPMGALVPLTVLWFNTGEKQKWMFIFLAVVPFVFSDTVKAVASVPQRYVETAETLGASRKQIITKVLFPLALPDIITSLRFQFGLALGYITLAEAINMTTGLGVLLNTSERRDADAHRYLLLFIIALLAFAIDWLIRYFQRGFFPYRKDL
jgi:ABC-type nitrate/sulfonate/bicarbonate transport system permease component